MNKNIFISHSPVPIHDVGRLARWGSYPVSSIYSFHESYLSETGDNLHVFSHSILTGTLSPNMCKELGDLQGIGCAVTRQPMERNYLHANEATNNPKNAHNFVSWGGE